MDETVEAIIFDFGGVLIHIDYNATADAFRRLGITDIDAMYSQARQHELFDAIETGKISPQQFVNRLLDFLPAGTSPNQVVSAWNAMILDVPASSISLLEQLKEKGYPLFLLSNTNALHIDVALRRWKQTSDKMPADLFDQVYLSHEMGMRKPDPAIFRRVCDEQGLQPAHVLFVDDSIQHVLGAREAGLQAIHLTADRSLQEIFS